MREIKETSGEAWIHTNHNCHQGRCAVTKTKSYRVERTEAKNKRPEVTHKSFNSYIVNAGAHYNADLHRAVTDAVWSPVTPGEWSESITQGLSVWYKRCPPKDEEMHTAEDNEAGPEPEPEDLLGVIPV
ncbi:uncharacterized protein MELLADRAFT_110116 [Melampsora larici-populina 98AG31]|uniref:Uncharacterized protein n=1 Tax=Melampsora larici-populina (strain 98AG31 / pathotype 3-4-7) TaxID=747676 RepID=F4RYQ5_MELLP|nr:uncharacterized protein MELLADRAFT_110116 [Melampsora larici-populina 98AG31]EGG02511.1 hypothetical protein MELLADRAFT_110116 [Melampsora larici-populina 98AG31]